MNQEGVKLRWADKFDPKKERYIRARCPHCSEEHSWSSKYGICPKDFEKELIKNGYKIIELNK